MPTQFCNYTIQGELGEGGMAIVYRAANRHGEIVALKVMLPRRAADPAMRKRFNQEARLRLNHPNVIQILDAGECDGTPYFVMPLIEGKPLDKVLNDAKMLALPQILPVLKDVSAGLDFAHSRGIIHRDIKPSNILIRAEDGRAIVTDFGVAKDTEATWSSTLVGTQTGMRVGTPQYMSPEQAQGAPTLTLASDVYALGVLVYRALCGRVPFDAPDDLAVLRMHLQDQPPDLRKWNPAISSAVAGVVLRALSKDPARRYQTAHEFVTALEKAQYGGWNNQKMIIAGISGMATVLMGVFLLAMCRPDPPNPPPAATPSNRASATPTLGLTGATATLVAIATPTPMSSVTSTSLPVPSDVPTASSTPNTPQKTYLPPTPKPPLGKVALITSPRSGAVLAGEWVDVYGQASCSPLEIEYWKFEFDNGGFIAKFYPGQFAGNMLMHWKVASITTLIGNNQTRNVQLVVVCKDGNFATSPAVRYTFRQ